MGVEEITRETIEKGGVLATLYFDAHAKSKEKVEGMLVELGNKLASEKGVVYAVSKVEKALEHEDGLFSAAASVRILTKSFPALARICVLYGPMGVEIEKPNEIRLSLHDAQELLFETAQMSYEFTTTMLYKLLSPEERKKLAEKLKRRAELGKQLLKKGEEEVKEGGKESS